LPEKNFVEKRKKVDVSSAGTFRGIRSPDTAGWWEAVEGMEAECRERQEMEVEALKGVYGLEEDGLHFGPNGALVVSLPIFPEEEEKEERAQVVFDLPALYPEADLGVLENVSAPCAASFAKDAGNEALRELAPDTEAGTPGVEALLSACEAVLRVVRDGIEALASDRRDAARAAGRRSAAGGDADNNASQSSSSSGNGPHNCVVHIDHMNDRQKYLKLLRRWSDDLGLGVRVFHRAGGVRRGPKGAENVFVCLSGPPQGISSFCSRLRTESVDVDAQGKKCKERKSKVLANRRPGDVKQGERPVPHFEGFEARECGTEEEVEAALQELNLLHCGDGRERFFAAEA